MGHRRASILCVGILLLLLLPLDATAAIPSGPSHKIVVDSTDTGTLKQLAQSGATLLADYGSFSLWRTNDTQKQAVAAQSSVKARDDFDLVHLRGGTAINTVAGAPPVATSAQQNKISGKQFWMVQYVGPIKPAWLARLRKLGIETVAYLPNNAYVVWLDGAQLTQLEQQAKVDPTIQWTGPYQIAYRIAPSLTAAKIAQAAQPVSVTVQFYKTTGAQASVASLRGLGGTVRRNQATVLNFVNISLDLPGNQIAAIASRADVFNVEPYTPPKKKDEVQDQIVAGNVTPSGGNVVPNAPGYRQWLIDHGFPTDPMQYPVVDVVDDGIDNGTTSPLHPDFYRNGDPGMASRVVFNNNCTTTDANADGQAGHGNLNAGIIAAYDDHTSGFYVDANGYSLGLGISPFGRVAGTKIFTNTDASGNSFFEEGGCSLTAGGFGSDEETVLAAATAGATITSNSWGVRGSAGAYDSEAQSYDALTRNARLAGSGSQQMLHVFSAGNDGAGGQTVGTPGTAKNVLTVGATENVRNDGVVDGCGDSAAANANNIANYSSRGPTADGRSKPDIVAPGTHIQGLASQDPTYDGTGVCGAAGNFDFTHVPGSQYYPDGQMLYTWSSGTSHAAPAVAGVASLVYNYYGRVVNPGQTPSPAMLKALILNAPRYLTGTSANDTLPSPNQGWGDANLGAIFDTAPRFVVDQTQTFVNTGETYIKGGTVANTGKPLRVTLVWTDAPGVPNGLASVNDLNLEVTVGGQTYKGNVFGGQYSAPGGTADTLNNVESVFLPPGTYGSFSVKVTAANLAGQGVDTSSLTNQDFALVVSNGAIAPTGALSAATVTASDAAPGGNANGSIDPGETIALTIGLINNGDAPATGVSGTLTTTTGTITINSGTVNYPTLAANSDPQGTPSATPFTFTVSGSHPCGTPIDFTAVINYNGGITQPISFSVPTGPLSVYVKTESPPKAIPDYDSPTNPMAPGTVSSLLPISGAGTVVGIKVKLTIHHTFDSDLTIQLIPPTGPTITLSDKNGYDSNSPGGRSENYINTTFDDVAARPIYSGIGPFTGSFRPEEPLSALAGITVSGTWKLFVSDNAAGDTGTIDQWALDIQPSVSSCTVFPPPTVSSISPASGDKGGGTTVTIKGTNFFGPTAVNFDNLPATNVTVVDSTTITAVTPAHGVGTATVTVTTNSTPLTPATPFTYGTTNPLPGPQPPGLPAGGSPAPAPASRPGPPPLPTNNESPAPLPPSR